jgi:predicted Fe-Mo cluster-binding NifX family protein
MKIAAISDDKLNVSQHFGRAPYYIVVTVEGGQITGKETRPKAGHQTFGGGEHEAAHGERHGYDAGAQARHGQMIDNIKDCQVVIAGGMGLGARESLKGAGIDTIVTDVRDIDEAVRLYAMGQLKNQEERLH